MHRIDGEGATPDGRFTEGNPITGEIPTVVTKGWLNDVQENIMRCLKEGGIAATKGRDLDLWDAIEAAAIKTVTDVLQGFEYVQDGGNVSGTIKGGKFTLTAPSPLDVLGDELVQDGGTISGVISLAAGTFTLTGGGGGSGGPAIEAGVLAVGTGGSIGPAKNANTVATWNGQQLGIANGSIGASGGQGNPAGAVIWGGVVPGQSVAAIKTVYAATIHTGATAAANFIDFRSDVINPGDGGTALFRVDMTGSGYMATGVWGAADYAEWMTGAVDLPVGISVVWDDGVRAFSAAQGDRPSHIIGVTRPRDTRAALIGNAAEDAWAGRYLTDDFGAPVWTEGQDGDGRPLQVRAVNPAYDPTRPYIPRSQRPEWSLIGLLGQIPVCRGQPVNPRWIRLRDLSETVSLYLVR